MGRGLFLIFSFLTKGIWDIKKNSKKGKMQRLISLNFPSALSTKASWLAIKVSIIRDKNPRKNWNGYTLICLHFWLKTAKYFAGFSFLMLMAQLKLPKNDKVMYFGWIGLSFDL